MKEEIRMRIRYRGIENSEGNIDVINDVMMYEPFIDMYMICAHCPYVSGYRDRDSYLSIYIVSQHLHSLFSILFQSLLRLFLI